MQFPVPQFTDVEDRLIGNLTFRQFAIILVTGGLVFFTYSVSRDFIVTGIAALFLGAPGLVLAFADFNGRPMYRAIPVFIQYVTSSKVLMFRKQSMEQGAAAVATVKVEEPARKNLAPGEDPLTRLKRIQYQLEQRAKEEEELLKK
jgi:hypothetical protein